MDVYVTMKMTTRELDLIRRAVDSMAERENERYASTVGGERREVAALVTQLKTLQEKL